MNLLSESMDEPRFTRMDDNMWGMILGKSGKLPGQLAPEIVELAKQQGREFTDADPQSFYPDKLDEFREEMKKNNWDFGPDDEELFELAMHPEQYRDYKNGSAKKRFDQELANAKVAALSKGISAEEVLKVKRAKYTPIVATQRGQVLWEIDVDSTSTEPTVGKSYTADDTFCYVMTPWGSSDSMKANFNGKIVEICVKQGERVNKGDVLAYIEEAK